jgi:N-acyl-D-amino-acid deacylase
LFDIVIENGLVIDGTGRAAEYLDVAVKDGKVVATGSIGDVQALRRIDASGVVVAPGFVDPHSHTDYTVHANRDADSTIRQGVTTEIVGNCGITNAPVSAASRPAVKDRLRGYGYNGPVSWMSFGEFLAEIENGGTSQNLAWLVGHSAVRAAAGIRGEEISDHDMTAMENYVEEAMEAGALGMSTGLEFREGRLAGPDELLRLATVVGRHDGYYASHIRNRDAAILDAVEEFLQAIRCSGAHGQISHLNVRYDTGAPSGAWEDAVALMVEARVSGLDVQADMTPFQQGLGDMAGILPAWLLEDGPSKAADLLGDREVRRRVRQDSDRYWRFVHKGQWHRVRLLHSEQFPEFDGLRFPEIAAARGADEWSCFFDILQAANGQMEDLEMVGDLFAADDLANQLKQPLFSCGVDAYSSSAAPESVARGCSPLSFSGHTEYLSVHVRERRTLSLEEMIRKLTSLPASRFGLKARGRVAAGYFADLIIFDPATIGSEATFANPAVYPTGVAYVIVNGQIVVDHGHHTGARPGQVLRRAG